MKHLIKCMVVSCVIIGGSSQLAHAGFLKNLSNELGVTVKTIDQVKTIGYSDEQWAKNQGLSGNEYKIYLELKSEWIDYIIENNRFARTSLESSKIKRRNCKIQLPESATTDVIAIATKRYSGEIEAQALYLTEDGFYSCLSDDAEKIYFIYYNALSHEQIRHSKDHLLKLYDGPNFKENRLRPWDIEKIKQIDLMRQLTDLNSPKSLKKYNQLLEIYSDYHWDQNCRYSRDRDKQDVLIMEAFTYIMDTNDELDASELIHFLDNALDNFKRILLLCRNDSQRAAILDLRAWGIKKAADLKASKYQFLYGECLELGNGVTKDTTKAVEYYRLAAEQGNTKAKERLATLEWEASIISDSEADGLKQKAAQLKSDTLVFNGFYLGMSIDDACALMNYYLEKQSYKVTQGNSGVKTIENANGVVCVMADASGNVVEFNFNRNLLDVIFKTIILIEQSTQLKQTTLMTG